jgi:hypothetical protein
MCHASIRMVKLQGMVNFEEAMRLLLLMEWLDNTHIHTHTHTQIHIQNVERDGHAQVVELLRAATGTVNFVVRYNKQLADEMDQLQMRPNNKAVSFR